MSPRPRSKVNKGHPKGWRWKHGAWRYRVPPGCEQDWGGKTEYTLGRTDAEAYRTWYQHVLAKEQIYTMNDLLDRYTHDVIPTKKPKTQEANLTAVKRLKAVFGPVPVDQITPKDGYKLLDMLAKKVSETTANRVFEVLSHALTMAVRWGVVERNCMKGAVQKFPSKARDRYVSDKELSQAIKHATPMLRLYIELKHVTGLRRGDILNLTKDNLTEDGIMVDTSKTEMPLLFEWTTDLWDLINDILSLPRIVHDGNLFQTRQGSAYIDEEGKANAFDSMWQRFMAKVVGDGVQRFQERDLRAKSSSDEDNLDSASNRLGHTSRGTTLKHYRRKARKVLPLTRPRF